jgi:hypothetical protein
MATTTGKLDLKRPEDLNEFLNILKEYGFKTAHVPVLRYIFIEGKFECVEVRPDGTGKICLVYGNKYLEVRINSDGIVMTIITPDTDKVTEVKKLTIEKNITVFSQVGPSFLNIEY